MNRIKVGLTFALALAGITSVHAQENARRATKVPASAQASETKAVADVRGKAVSAKVGERADMRGTAAASRAAAGKTAAGKAATGRLGDSDTGSGMRPGGSRSGSGAMGPGNAGPRVGDDTRGSGRGTGTLGGMGNNGGGRVGNERQGGGGAKLGGTSNAGGGRVGNDQRGGGSASFGNVGGGRVGNDDRGGVGSAAAGGATMGNRLQIGAAGGRGGMVGKSEEKAPPKEDKPAEKQPHKEPKDGGAPEKDKPKPEKRDNPYSSQSLDRSSTSAGSASRQNRAANVGAATGAMRNQGQR